MSLSPTAIATAIAALSPIDTDIMVKDLDGILQEVSHTDTPVLMPAPRYVTAFTPEFLSTGTGTSRAVNVTYNLNYRFFFQILGSSTKIADVYQAFVNKTYKIQEAIFENDSLATAIDISPNTIEAFDVVFDPRDRQFWGTDMSFAVLEFQS